MNLKYCKEKIFLWRQSVKIILLGEKGELNVKKSSCPANYLVKLSAVISLDIPKKYMVAKDVKFTIVIIALKKENVAKSSWIIKTFWCLIRS